MIGLDTESHPSPLAGDIKQRQGEGETDTEVQSDVESPMADPLVPGFPLEKGPEDQRRNDQIQPKGARDTVGEQLLQK